MMRLSSVHFTFTTMITITTKTLQHKLELYTEGWDYHLIYVTDDIEVIDRQTLKDLSDTLGCLGDITLYTNAGTDLHSSEDTLYGITVKRLAPEFKPQLQTDLTMAGLLAAK